MSNQKFAKHALLKLLAVMFLIGAPLATANAEEQQVAEEHSCRVIEVTARAYRLPVALLTRLFWYESRFQIGAVSQAGAQGIAQFMPATAKAQGLGDPFDLDLAIPMAARFVAELEQQFGNIGLAVAAYNAGPSRVANWLDRTGNLPYETSRLVLAVTGHDLEEWGAFYGNTSLRFTAEPQSCIELTAILRRPSLSYLGPANGHLLFGLEKSGQLLPALKGSGRVLPGLQQSGRLLAGIVQSSHPLPQITVAPAISSLKQAGAQR